MSQLGTFTEYHDYFSAIATSHVDINGFKFGEKDVMRCSARSSLNVPTLWVESYDPINVLDSKSDAHGGQIRGVLYVIAPDPKKWDTQRTLYGQTEAIVKQIIAKILKDYNEGLLQAQLENYKYGWSEMQLGATQMLGCRLDFSFIRPERLSYDDAKWI